jgi:hypothetical protein
MPESTITSGHLTGDESGAGRAGRKHIPNPYVQVALTYLRRPFSSPLNAVFSLLYVIISGGYFAALFSGGRNDMPKPIIIIIMSSWTIMLFWFFAVHVKNQFTDSRARLTPGFCRVHVAVAAAVALVLVVLFPAALIWLAGLRSVGIVAVSVLAFGAIFCSTMVPVKPLSWILALCIVAIFLEPVRDVLWRLLAGQYEVQAIALLAIGAALTIYGGIKLVGLNEDVPSYHRPILNSWSGNYTRVRPLNYGVWMLPSGARERLMEKNIARCVYHARRASVSRLSRVCRWEFGMPAGWLIFPVILIVCGYISISIFAGDILRKAEMWYILSFYFFFLPLLFWMYFRHWRMPMLGRELLLPVDRRDFVRQIGMAALLVQLRIWAGMSAGIALWMAITAGEALSISALASLLAIFTLLQPWFFGVGAWLMKYRSVHAIVFGFMMAIYLSFVPCVLSAATSPYSSWSYATLPLAAVIGILGLLLCRGAYRHWLTADFDDY